MLKLALAPEAVIETPLLFALPQSKVVDDVTTHAATTVFVTLPPLPFGTVTVPEKVPAVGGGLGGDGGGGGLGGVGGDGGGGDGGGFPTCPGKINNPETELEPPPTGGGGGVTDFVPPQAERTRTSADPSSARFFMPDLPFSRFSRLGLFSRFLFGLVSVTSESFRA